MSLGRDELNISKQQSSEIHLEPQEINAQTNSVMKLYDTNVKNSGSVVKSKWMQSEWLKNGIIPDKTLEKQVKDAYRNAHDGHSIGIFEKPKANKEARRKQGMMLKAARVYKKFYTTSARETQDIEAMNEEFVEKGQDELAREAKGLSYIIENKEEKISFFETLRDGTNEEKVEAIKPLLDKMLSIKDFSRYSYKNDNELLSKFTKYRKELNAGVTLRKMVIKYKELGGELESFDEARLMAIAETLQAIMFRYDSRIKLLQNPYYALLRDKTYAGRSVEDLDDIVNELQDTPNADPALIAYINQLSESKSFFDGEKDISGKFTFHGNDAERIFQDALSTNAKKIVPRDVWEGSKIQEGRKNLAKADLDKANWAREDLTDEELETKIRNAYNKMENYGGPSLSRKTLNKLKRSYKAKLERARKAGEVLDTYYNCLTVSTLIWSEERYKNSDRAVANMISLYSSTKHQKNYLEIMEGDDIEKKEKVIELIYSKMKAIDVNRFDFANDDEFFRTTIGLLPMTQAFGDAINLLEKVEKEGAVFSNEFKAKFYTRAKLFESLNDYCVERLEMYRHEAGAYIDGEELLKDKEALKEWADDFKGDHVISSYLLGLQRRQSPNPQGGDGARNFDGTFKVAELEKELSTNMKKRFTEVQKG